MLLLDMMAQHGEEFSSSHKKLIARQTYKVPFSNTEQEISQGCDPKKRETNKMSQEIALTFSLELVSNQGRGKANRPQNFNEPSRLMPIKITWRGMRGGSVQ